MDLRRPKPRQFTQPYFNMKTSVYIGVDPAFRKGGFWACILDYSDRSVRFLRFDDLLEWHDWLRSDDAPRTAYVVIENSNAQNRSFDVTGTRRHVARKARNVGTNQGVSQLAYLSALRHFGDHCAFSVTPRQKGQKWTPEQYAQVLKSEGITTPKRTNQDQRDALKLAFMAVKLSKIKNSKFRL